VGTPATFVDNSLFSGAFRSVAVGGDGFVVVVSGYTLYGFGANGLSFPPRFLHLFFFRFFFFHSLSVCLLFFCPSSRVIRIVLIVLVLFPRSL